MCVYLRPGRPDGFYYYDFKHKGKRYFRSTEKTNYRKALEVEAEARWKVRNGISLELDKSISFAAYVPRVMALVEVQRMDKPRTVEFYRDTYAKILQFLPLANSDLRDITDPKITDFALFCRSKNLAPGTINRRLACIRKLLLMAKREGLIDRCPKMPFGKERERQFIFTPGLKAEFMAGLPQSSRPLVLFLFETALRVGEAIHLKWNDVAPDRSGHLYVRIRNGKSEAAKRFVPLSREAERIVTEQRQLSLSDYVFVRLPAQRVPRRNWNTAPMSRDLVSHHCTERRRQMGLPSDCVLHSTRHTALTNLGAAGAGLFDIMKVAGHTTAAMSQKYVHPQLDQLRDLMEKASRGGSKTA